jgi:hypothetical protein
VTDKDRVNYILNGPPETPDDELPDPKEKRKKRFLELYNLGWSDDKIGKENMVRASSL